MIVYNAIYRENTLKFNMEGIVERLRIIKSEEEIKRITIAAKDDSLAFFRIWMYYEGLDFKKEKIDEVKMRKEIERIRSTTPNYLMPSFKSEFIVNKNSEIHRISNKKQISDIIEEKDILLVKSGGQYRGYGTTNVIRMFVKSVTKVNPLILDDYTYILKAQISVFHHEFDKKEFTNDSLSLFLGHLIRSYFGRSIGHNINQAMGMESDVIEDFHSIGNKVEIPDNIISSKEARVHRNDLWTLKLNDNVVSYTSNQGKKGFRNLTLICYEEKLINKELLEDKEIKYINDYHENVIKTMTQMKNIDDETLNFIKQKCFKIG